MQGHARMARYTHVATNPRTLRTYDVIRELLLNIEFGLYSECFEYCFTRGTLFLLQRESAFVLNLFYFQFLIFVIK